MNFKEWLSLKEGGSTDYLRNPGTRELEPNPFMRAARNTTPWDYAAITQGGQALAGSIRDTMYTKGSQHRAPGADMGYGGSFEGYTKAGLEHRWDIPVNQVGNDQQRAKHEALRRSLERLQESGRMDDFNIQAAMVSKQLLVRRGKGGDPAYHVIVTIPFVGRTPERVRDTEDIGDILAARRDLPDLLSAYR